MEGKELSVVEKEVLEQEENEKVQKELDPHTLPALKHIIS
jgi:hypothetical protein